MTVLLLILLTFLVFLIISYASKIIPLMLSGLKNLGKTKPVKVPGKSRRRHRRLRIRRIKRLIKSFTKNHVFIVIMIIAVGVLTYFVVIYRNTIEISIISFLLGNKELVDPYDYGSLVEVNDEWTEVEKIINTGIFFNDDGIISVEKVDKDSPKMFFDFAKTNTNIYGMSPDKKLIEFGELDAYEYFDGTSLRSVDEISADIKTYDSPMNAPAQLYIEEFYARAKSYSKKQNNENTYQTARAADDIVTILCKGNSASCDLKELVYFSNLCMQYYTESFKYDALDYITRNEIYFKMAIVIQKLMYRSELGNDKTSLLLYSNALLELAESYEQNDSLFDNQFDYYYGISLYNVGLSCNIEEIDYHKKTLLYLERYLGKKNKKKEYAVSCSDTIERIYKAYPSLIGTVSGANYYEENNFLN